ncbi:hypothetical protein LNK15_12335, partial [Jeotgalicoccus huakuii]|nr:hypothetical protein [Jeotgalicoccus huakuii]
IPVANTDESWKSATIANRPPTNPLNTPKHAIDLGHYLPRCILDGPFITAQYPAVLRNRTFERLGTGNLLVQAMDHRTAQPTCSCRGPCP